MAAGPVLIVGDIMQLAENETNRARYEVHSRTLGEVDFSRQADGNYVSARATAMWEFWQAAQASLNHADTQRGALPRLPTDLPAGGWQAQALRIVQHYEPVVAGQCAVMLLRDMLAAVDLADNASHGDRDEGGEESDARPDYKQ